MAETPIYKGKRFGEMTKEELSAAGKAGAYRTHQIRREKKAMKEVIGVLLTLPLKKGGKCYLPDELQNMASLKGKNIDVQTAIVIAQIQKALKGDVNSAIFLRDTGGDKPRDELNIDGNIPVVISGDDKLED